MTLKLVDGLKAEAVAGRKYRFFPFYCTFLGFRHFFGFWFYVGERAVQKADGRGQTEDVSFFLLADSWILRWLDHNNGLLSVSFSDVLVMYEVCANQGGSSGSFEAEKDTIKEIVNVAWNYW